jgi:two-component system, sensor histidine kinase
MTSSIPPTTGERVLVLLPDADQPLIRTTLEQAGMSAVYCRDVDAVCQEMETGAGAAVVAEETLTPDSLRCLVTKISRQENWSDFPVVALFKCIGSDTAAGLRMLDMLEPLGNGTVLERPVSPMTLISILRAALRGRRHQFEVRNLVHQREEAVRDSDEFLTLLAHELRNPLSAIRNATHILNELSAQSEVAREQRAVIDRQTGHLARLVDGVLEVHRLISRRVSLRKELVDLVEVLSGALRGVKPDTHDREESPTLLAPAGELLVEGDREQLTRVFHHLLAEVAHWDPVRLNVSREGNEAVIRLKAPGIDNASNLPLPDRLTEVIRLLDRPRGGLAVALLLIRNLVTLHGGNVQGPYGDGELVIRLQVQGEQASKTVPKTRGSGDSSRKSILVAEDSRDARESLCVLLQLWGHQAQGAEDGLKAVEKALASPPEVALVDIGLPGLDGYEVARTLRSHLGNEVFLVAVTGYGEPHDRRRALEAGFDTYLTKPVLPETLRDLLARGAES